MNAAWLLLGVVCLPGYVLCTNYHHDYSGRTSWRPQEECNKISLMNYLFSRKRYSPAIRPKDGEGPVTIEHRYELIRFVNLHFDLETGLASTKLLCLDVWEDFKWNDPRLSWSTEKCNVAGSLHIPLDKLWVPDVAVDKNAGPMPNKIERNTATVNSNGDIFVGFNRQIKSYCDPIEVNGTEIVVPDELSCGDEFKCEIPVNSWMLQDGDLKLTVGEPGGGMGTSELTGSSSLYYQLINTTSTITSKKYTPFPGNFDTIIYTVWLRFFPPGC